MKSSHSTPPPQQWHGDLGAEITETTIVAERIISNVSKNGSFCISEYET